MGRRSSGSSTLIDPWIWASGGAILGAILGSFLATIVIRWPRGGTVRRGRSACDSCNKPLAPRDLVPIFSFLWTRGLCRYCAAPIPRVHIIMEGMAALIGAAAVTAAPNWIGITGAVFGWMLLLLAALDLRHYWLPDRVTGAMAVLGLVVGVLGTLPFLAEPQVHPDLWGRVFGALAGFLGLAAVALIYRSVRKREGLGGGDPKMLGAIGAWVGLYAVVQVLLGATIIGLSFVLIKAINRERIKFDDKLPLGALMALAAFPVWLWMQSS